MIVFPIGRFWDARNHGDHRSEYSFRGFQQSDICWLLSEEGGNAQIHYSTQLWMFDLKKQKNVYLTERGSDRLAQERGRHVGNGGQNEVVQCWPVDDRRVVFAKTFATWMTVAHFSKNIFSNLAYLWREIVKTASVWSFSVGRIA